MKKGDVEHEDFERYIYGGNANSKTSDDRDRIESEMSKQLTKY